MTPDRFRAEAATTPIAKTYVSRPEHFAANAHWPFFDRLRAEDPVHYLVDSDFELLGKTIKAADKVIMWYVSANRDDTKFDDPYAFQIDRKNARSHMSFGFGVHRCMGNHVAEMQLRILWEEIMVRFPVIEVVEGPERVSSNFVMGFSKMMVRIPA